MFVQLVNCKDIYVSSFSEYYRIGVLSLLESRSGLSFVGKEVWKDV